MLLTEKNMYCCNPQRDCRLLGTYGGCLEKIEVDCPHQDGRKCFCGDTAKHLEGEKGYCDEHYLLLATERWQKFCSENK